MKKKLASILLLCVMFLTLTLPVSASQTVSEENQTRAQKFGNCGNYGTAVNALSLTFTLPALQTVSEENQAQECEACGKMTSNTVIAYTYDVGPASTECKHGFPFGDDLTWKVYTAYQHVCEASDCLYKSELWDTPTGNNIECHGHY